VRPPRYLALVALLGWLPSIDPAPASADTLSLSVSPSSIPMLAKGQLTVSASGTATDEYWVSLPVTGPCPAAPTEGAHIGGGDVAELPKTYEVASAWGGQGRNKLCGYLRAPWSPCPPSCHQVLSTAEVTYTVTPSAKELEEEGWRREEEERQTRYRAEEAAEAKAKAEAPAREAAAKAAAKAAQEAKAALEEREYFAAVARARAVPAKHLSVKAIGHNGHSSWRPGFTNLDVTTSPYAFVTVKLARYGHTMQHIEWGARASDVAEVVNWTCQRPGGTYFYTVTARTNVGATLTKRGHFKPVSASRCDSLKRYEAEARERSAREYAERRSREAREAREVLGRWEGNCRALGGTPVTLYTSEGRERACRAPGGGLLPVPN
jgi:hypothetical protein